jgi:large subunit ribosomal protein L4
VPRTYGFKLTKKTRKAALRGALSLAVRDGRVTVVDSLEIGEYKTKRVVGALDALSLSGKSVLIVLDEPNPTLAASARNLPGVTVIRAEGVNVYDALRHSHLVLTQAAVERLGERLAGAKEGAS